MNAGSPARRFIAEREYAGNCVGLPGYRERSLCGAHVRRGVTEVGLAGSLPNSV